MLPNIPQEDMDSIERMFVLPGLSYTCNAGNITVVGTSMFLYQDGSTKNMPWRMCVGKNELGRAQLATYFTNEEIDRMFASV